jgi:hypothetical protein
METKQVGQAHSAVLLHAVEWWREARVRWRRLRELHQMSHEEIERIAHELGMSPVDFLRVACEPDNMPMLLERRLAALRLSAWEIHAVSPLLVADLKRNCSDCSESQRCEADMRVDPLIEGWESYCPNSDTLKTLV